MAFRLRSIVQGRKCQLTIFVLFTLLATFVQSNACPKGRFGPACAFSDIRYDSEYVKVGRGTAETGKKCQPVGALEPVEIRINLPISMTWIRVVALTDELAANYLNISLRAIGGFNVGLVGQKRIVTKHVIDVFFTVTVAKINKVFIQGYIASTCGIFISGGQNLANNFPWLVSQSKNSTSHPATNCIDGNLTTYCETSARKGEKSWWRAEFQFPAYIYFYRIYNMIPWHLRKRAVGMRVELYYPSGRVSYNIKDSQQPAPKIYNKTIHKPGQKISKYLKVIMNQYLNLREIEVYGDYKCPYNTHGPMCEATCNCTKGETCFSNTGGCASKGCPVGFRGRECSIPCTEFEYGFQCSKACSLNCGGDKRCDAASGHCRQGCLPSFQSPRCDTCVPGYYSRSCNLTCPQNCLLQECDFVSGSCKDLLCTPGWSGLWCDERCSSNCAGKGECRNGTCLEGCKTGYMPPTCTDFGRIDVALFAFILIIVGAALSYGLFFLLFILTRREIETVMRASVYGQGDRKSRASQDFFSPQSRRASMASRGQRASMQQPFQRTSLTSHSQRSSMAGRASTSQWVQKTALPQGGQRLSHAV